MFGRVELSIPPRSSCRVIGQFSYQSRFESFASCDELPRALTSFRTANQPSGGLQGIAAARSSVFAAEILSACSYQPVVSTQQPMFNSLSGLDDDAGAWMNRGRACSAMK
jgi:hypothetical protein